MNDTPPAVTAVRKASRRLPQFILLYCALYAAYGTESAYLPAFMGEHGLAVEYIGIVFAAGTIVRIMTGPLAGRLADYLDARKQILAIAAGFSGIIGFAYILAYGFAALLAVSMAHAAVTASLAPLSDALSLAASAGGRAFQYGWVRGVGSAAFVGGTLLSGQLVERWGLSSIIVSSSALFLATAIAAIALRSHSAVPASTTALTAGALRTLWRVPAYRLLIVIAMLVIGSHALNDTFAVIHWRAAGYGNLAVSLLWSESVVAEVAVFFLIGPWLIARLGDGGAARLAAAAGVLRWGVMAATTAPPALIGVQALHGLTFALLHLAAMGIMVRVVPAHLAATAQTVYGTGALGIASAIMTLAAAYLYGSIGASAYWVMAALCAGAIPLTRGLTGPKRKD
jgi:MFS transporter, PPP family, 3-phenylpropionic acid transporter